MMKSIRFFLLQFLLVSFFISCSGDDDDDNYTPVKPVTPEEESEGEYQLVWSDEFDAQGHNLPNPAEWSMENGGHGWGNNELQYYLGTGFLDKDTVALINDGTLKITAFKREYQGNQYISARINTKKSWLYGKFEARLKVPAGKGGWPAFWMLPQNFQAWPLDGEIDIMEYVGYDPHVIHGTVHTQAYNHSIGTQKGQSTKVNTAETEFHIYSMEWTKNKIEIFVDGKSYFIFNNDGKNNKSTWPFNAPFYLKLNLAVGGNWGGQQGIDESTYPQVYEIDYVRVYQKK
jgi:beta-glucanase (GH16 family)